MVPSLESSNPRKWFCNRKWTKFMLFGLEGKKSETDKNLWPIKKKTNIHVMHHTKGFKATYLLPYHVFSNSSMFLVGHCDFCRSFVSKQVFFFSFRHTLAMANSCLSHNPNFQFPNTYWGGCASSELLHNLHHRKHNVPHLQESTIYPLPYTWAQSGSRLASVSVIDRGESVCNPSHPDMVNFALLDSRTQIFELEIFCWAIWASREPWSQHYRAQFSNL